MYIVFVARTLYITQLLPSLCNSVNTPDESPVKADTLYLKRHEIIFGMQSSKLLFVFVHFCQNVIGNRCMHVYADTMCQPLRCSYSWTQINKHTKMLAECTGSRSTSDLSSGPFHGGQLCVAWWFAFLFAMYKGVFHPTQAINLWLSLLSRHN